MKVVLYHKNCQDGLFSAYNLWKVFGSKGTIYIDVNYKPIQDMEAMEALEYIFNGYINSKETINQTKYNFENDKVTIDDYSEMDLYIVDYSFPVEHFIKHIELFKSILVLDHHKTAIESYLKVFKNYKEKDSVITIEPFSNSKIVFSKNESGAKLSYRYFNEGKEIPDYIELVSDYDLHTFNLKYTRAFNYGITMFEINSFNIMENLLKTSLHNIIYVGEKYDSLYNNRVRKITDSNLIDIIIKLNGVEYKGCLINTFPDNRNEVCTYAIKEKGYDIAITYNIYKQLDVSCSLRSKDGLDASYISLAFGGGGHEHASAFRIKLDQFTKIVNDKLIEVNYNKEEE